MNRLAIAALVFAGCGGATEHVPDAGEPAWARYVIHTGAHEAEVLDAQPKNPVQGVTDAVGRDYELAFDASAAYVLTMPTQPEDQLDWNKLPGLSDCDETDLAKDGAMFGWRWRPDTAVLEIAAYANNASMHLPSDVLFTLDSADLDAAEPIRYRVWRDAEVYRFEAAGSVRGRVVTASTTLPRRCAGAPLDPLAWAGAFYFGGTSVAPHEITARVRETSFQ